MTAQYGNYTKSLWFTVTPEKNIIARTEYGFCPVARFEACLIINGKIFRASFALDDNGNLQRSDCPFEEIAISLSEKWVKVKENTEFSLDTDENRIQGVITALVPKPRGEGNQYVTIFVDQMKYKKRSVEYYSSSEKEVCTIYHALSAVMSNFEFHTYMTGQEEIS